MTRTTMNFQGKLMKLLSLGILATGALAAGVASAAIPGINPVANATTGALSIGLTASADYTGQPDGATIYSWGYGCTTGSTRSSLTRRVLSCGASPMWRSAIMPEIK